MAKAKYKQNSRGEWETKIWGGTYNADGSKHRKRLISRKSSADLERQVNQLKNEVDNGQYVQSTDVTFLEYARSWLKTKKAAREINTQKMYENVIETHLSFLEDVRLCDIRNSHFQLAINNALDKPRTCQQIEVTFKQVLKMAVADNYIGAGMYDKICADINLPKYVKKKSALSHRKKKWLSRLQISQNERKHLSISYTPADYAVEKRWHCQNSTLNRKVENTPSLSQKRLFSQITRLKSNRCQKAIMGSGQFQFQTLLPPF